MTIDEAMVLLSAHEGMTFEQLKRQYRLLVMQNHPDRLSSRSKTAVDQQTLKVARIIEAYKLLLNQKQLYGTFVPLEKDSGALHVTIIVDCPQSKQWKPFPELNRLWEIQCKLRLSGRGGLALALLQAGEAKCEQVEKWKDYPGRFQIGRDIGFDLVNAGFHDEGLGYFIRGGCNLFAANCLFRLGRFEEALPVYREELDNSNYRTHPASIYRYMAITHFMLGHFRECVSLMENEYCISMKDVEVVSEGDVKYVAELLSYSICELEGGCPEVLSDELLARKYPVCSSIIGPTLGGTLYAKNFVEAVKRDPARYEKFLRRVQRPLKVDPKIELDYDPKELESLLSELFSERPLVLHRNTNRDLVWQ